MSLIVAVVTAAEGDDHASADGFAVEVPGTEHSRSSFIRNTGTSLKDKDGPHFAETKPFRTSSRWTTSGTLIRTSNLGRTGSKQTGSGSESLGLVLLS